MADLNGESIGCSSNPVRLNIGGLKFETSLSTLQKDPDSMLGRMFSEDWLSTNGSIDRETFIDRDGRRFHFILNFLRDGSNVILPENVECLMELLREAEYYQMNGLIELCRAKLRIDCRPFKEGDFVTWKPDSIESYWRPFALSLIQEGVEMGFLYDRVGKKYTDKQTVATCIACLAKFPLDQVTVFEYKLRFEEWESLKHHMRRMKGQVHEVIEDTCCVVKWSNGKQLHIPMSAVTAF